MVASVAASVFSTGCLIAPDGRLQRGWPQEFSYWNSVIQEAAIDAALVA